MLDPFWASSASILCRSLLHKFFDLIVLDPLQTTLRAVYVQLSYFCSSFSADKRARSSFPVPIALQSTSDMYCRESINICPSVCKIYGENKPLKDSTSFHQALNLVFFFLTINAVK